MNTINEKFEGYDRDSTGKRWEEYETITCPDGQVIDMVKLLKDQEIAKAALLHIMPWFGEVATILKPIYTFRVKTQGTDGNYLLINPQFTYNLDMTGKVFLMAHEIMHCMLNHMRRGDGHDHDRSNVAADYEVNLWIEGVGLTPKSAISKLRGYFDEKYRGWGYERIYDNVSVSSSDSMDNSEQGKQAQQNQQGQQGQQQSGSQSGKGQSGGQQKHSADFKAGWNQAMEDYKNGKIKI